MTVWPILRGFAVPMLWLLGRVGAAVLALATTSAARAAAPEQFAVYDVCKGLVGEVSYSYRAADDAFLVRCPRETEPRITIKRCKGRLSFDTRYNVIVTCPDGRSFPIVRGPYPR